MAADEHARHELCNRLEEQLRAELSHDLLATLRAEINAQTRLLFFSMIGALFTAVALAFAAARIT